MLVFSKLFRKTNTLYVFSNKYISLTAKYDQLIKPVYNQKSKSKEIGPFGWFLLLIPTATCALGTWQIQRKKWKEDLLLDLKSRTTSQPVLLPENLDELPDLEYYPVHVKGYFLHDKELYMGPRTLLTDGDASTQSSLLSKNQNKSQGYLVITPFKLSGRNETILINRGWVPAKLKDPKNRMKGQVTDEVNIIGILRKHENRPNFMPSNNVGSNAWLYRDLDEMSRVTGSSPVYLDATNDFPIEDGPIGGQTRISLRNEHLSYVFTWYSLCGITSYMWFKKFLKPK